MNESELTRKQVKRLNSIPQVFAVKIHGGPHQQRGLPDITGCVEGAFFGIEMKMPGKERNITKLQKATLDKINRAGGLTGLATCWNDICVILGLEDYADA